MTVSGRIRVLRAFSACHRILRAFHRDNFQSSDRRDILRSTFHALCAALIIVLVSIYFVLAAWYLVDNATDLRIIVVILPIVISLLYIDLTFIAMVVQNRSVTETINRLQRVVDRRNF